MKKGVLTVAIIILFTHLSFACGCAEKTVKESYQKSNLVFTGKLIKKELVVKEIKAPKIEEVQSYATYQYTFEILVMYKGKQAIKEVVLSSKYRNTLNFKENNEYLVYAFNSNYLLTSNFYLNGEKVPSFLAVDNCSRSKEIVYTDKKELKKLRKYSKRE
jgi:hypothetical protein